MSDWALWIERVQAADEQYELCGGEIPQGHPDEVPVSVEELDRVGRYFDAPEPWRSPARESDDWFDPEELAA